METLLFYITLYLIGAAILFTIFMIKYHNDKPWYTWSGKYSLRTVYWIGVVSIAIMMLVGWWIALFFMLFGAFDRYG